MWVVCDVTHPERTTTGSPEWNQPGAPEGFLSSQFFVFLNFDSGHLVRSSSCLTLQWRLRIIGLASPTIRERHYNFASLWDALNSHKNLPGKHRKIYLLCICIRIFFQTGKGQWTIPSHFNISRGSGYEGMI